MKGIKGFTVVELLMAIVIGAILVSIAIPSYLNMSQRNTISVTSNELLGAVRLARSEAVRQEEPTNITPVSNGWLVTSGGVDLVNHVVDSNSITIDGDTITYNPRGRASLTTTKSIDISYDGTVKSRICLSLTGRPFIRSAEDGTCP